jgi:hypothetical protein
MAQTQQAVQLWQLAQHLLQQYLYPQQGLDSSHLLNCRTL